MSKHAFWYASQRDPEEKKKVSEQLSAAKPAFDKLLRYIDSRIESSENAGMDDYGCPSWPYKTADQIGYNRAMREVKKLIAS